MRRIGRTNWEDAIQRAAELQKKSELTDREATENASVSSSRRNRLAVAAASLAILVPGAALTSQAVMRGEKSPAVALDLNPGSAKSLPSEPQQKKNEPEPKQDAAEKKDNDSENDRQKRIVSSDSAPANSYQPQETSEAASPAKSSADKSSEDSDPTVDVENSGGKEYVGTLPASSAGGAATKELPEQKASSDYTSGASAAGGTGYQDPPAASSGGAVPQLNSR